MKTHARVSLELELERGTQNERLGRVMVDVKLQAPAASDDPDADACRCPTARPLAGVGNDES